MPATNRLATCLECGNVDRVLFYVDRSESLNPGDNRAAWCPECRSDTDHRLGAESPEGISL